MANKTKSLPDYKLENKAKYDIMLKELKEIDELTYFLDVSEGIAPMLHPSHSFIAVQIRKKVRTLISTITEDNDVCEERSKENKGTDS